MFSGMTQDKYKATKQIKVNSLTNPSLELKGTYIIPSHIFLDQNEDETIKFERSLLDGPELRPTM